MFYHFFLQVFSVINRLFDVFDVREDETKIQIIKVHRPYLDLKRFRWNIFFCQLSIIHNIIIHVPIGKQMDLLNI